MSERSKRSKSRKKPSKKPSKKSVNAKKTRKTRKNKGGTVSEVVCTGQYAVSAGVAISVAVMMFTAILSMSNGAALMGGELVPMVISVGAGSAGAVTWGLLSLLTGQRDLNCDNLENKVFMSLKNIGSAMKIADNDKTVISIDDVEQRSIAFINIGVNIVTKNYKLYIKHQWKGRNMGAIVNKDEYYLFDDQNNLDILRSIAFTHMNRYISKYGILNSRKYHVLKTLKKYTAENLLDNVERIINNAKQLKKVSEEYSLDTFKKNINHIIGADDQVTAEIKKYWNAFRSAVIYFCNDNNYYANRSNLNLACTETAQTDTNTRSEFSDIQDTMRQIMFIPIMELSIHGDKYNELSKNNQREEEQST